VKRIAILGSTGSIGTQALDIIESNPELFTAEILTAQNNWELLVKQALNFNPNIVVIGNEDNYQKVKSALASTDVKVYTGKKAIEEVVQSTSVDLVLTALVGFAGLKPTIEAIKSKKIVALANKETLVVAGDIISKLVLEYKTPLLPVDSEHSAIFQCLMGEVSPVEKIILTASGGPFFHLSEDELKIVTVEQALNHPNWRMGNKVTIDSASLMNKGLEVIEAKWLFGLKPEQIEVVIHPQSIIHSMAQFEDGSIKAQMGMPDMRMPIQLAFTYPNRIKSKFPRVNFSITDKLTFEQPNTNKFRNLALAHEAMVKGGSYPCVLNAANEVAVGNFIERRIGFTQIPELIEQVMEKAEFVASPTVDEYLKIDAESRRIANELLTYNTSKWRY